MTPEELNRIADRPPAARLANAETDIKTLVAVIRHTQAMAAKCPETTHCLACEMSTP